MARHLLRPVSFLCFLFFLAPAYADVFGRIEVTLINENTREAVQGAHVTFHDSTHAIADIDLVSDGDGVAVSKPLPARVWLVRAAAAGFEVQEKRVVVKPDTVTKVKFQLERGAMVIRITGEPVIVIPEDTSGSTNRTREFESRFPVSVRAPQQLTGLLLSVPGFVSNSANQVHARGEHSASSILLQGFQLGGVAQGRFGPLVDPQAFEGLDIMTGGFAPEYAGAAAVLNSSIRSGTVVPESSLELGGGNFRTGIAKITHAGQTGAEYGAPLKSGTKPKVLSYFLSGSARTTGNALEAPQPDLQTAHNRGASFNALGRFDARLGENDALSLIVSSSPARTQIANRTGLPDEYAPLGQGYGFGGALSADEAARKGILSQDRAGQDIYQKDQNDFGLLQWRSNFGAGISSIISGGLIRSRLGVFNNNPGVNLAQLPEDNSIEYNPAVRRDALHRQAAASVSILRGSHEFKFGGMFDYQSSDDSYELTPASQRAVNALFAADPRLAPQGEVLLDAGGSEVFDELGNPVYLLSEGAAVPRAEVSRSGYAAGVFAQDTWRLNESFTANYGLRLDSYRQSQDFGLEDVQEHQLSPRVNLSYAFSPKWIGRASYNRLFIDPPISQGSVIGNAIKTERVHQYEGSIERQITQNQRAKISYYLKHIKNQVDTGLLIPSTQLGVYTSVSLETATVRGFEFSYEWLPDHGYGPSAFLAYALSKARPGGTDSFGESVPSFNDHDQRHTLAGGLAYNFSDGAMLSSNFYFGSGVASSALEENGRRQKRFMADLSFTSAPFLFHKSGRLRLSVTNIFDERERINFNSPFSGTRFEQGRAYVLSTLFSF